MTLDELIRQMQITTDYNEWAAESALKHYMRFYARQVAEIVALSQDLETEDVQQELRICMYQAWLCYDNKSNMSLRQWISWKTRYKLLDIRRRALKRAAIIKYETLGSTDSNSSCDE